MEYLLITENENALNFADSAFSTVALQQELKSAVTFTKVQVLKLVQHCWGLSITWS